IALLPGMDSWDASPIYQGGRLAMAWVDCCGGFVMVRVYLRTVEGLSAGSLAILGHLAVVLAVQDHPWACAGDFNMEPEELMQAQELAEL
ncbi:MAG: hypothetical protein ACKPKO_20145, partial [Candidatus Fonsibacter sp.]